MYVCDAHMLVHVHVCMWRSDCGINLSCRGSAYVLGWRSVCVQVAGSAAIAGMSKWRDSVGFM